MEHEEKFGSQSTPRGTQTQRRATQGRRPPERRPLRSRMCKSTRQCCRIEFALTPSKQRIDAAATRQFLAGSPVPIFQFPISNFAFSLPEKGVNQNQVFANATHSKQTSRAPKGCQFFAMCFSISEKSQDAGLPGTKNRDADYAKAAALHSSLGETKTTARKRRGGCCRACRCQCRRTRSRRTACLLR